MTKSLRRALSFSRRDLPEFCNCNVPPETRGRREHRMLAAPASLACKKAAHFAHARSHRAAGAVRHSLRCGTGRRIRVICVSGKANYFRWKGLTDFRKWARFARRALPRDRASLQWAQKATSPTHRVSVRSSPQTGHLDLRQAFHRGAHNQTHAPQQLFDHLVGPSEQ